MENKCLVFKCSACLDCVNLRPAGWLWLSVEGEDTLREHYRREGLLCPRHAYCIGALL